MHLKIKFANFIQFGNREFYLLNIGQPRFGLLYFQVHQKSHYIKYKMFSIPLKVDIKYKFASWKNLGTSQNHEFEATMTV